MVEKRSSLEDSRRNLLELNQLEVQMSASTNRPLEHPSRPSSRTNGNGLRRSASAMRANQSQPQSPNFENERQETFFSREMKYGCFVYVYMSQKSVFGVSSWFRRNFTNSKKLFSRDHITYQEL